MIWRLTYCNKEGVQARLDIIRGASTPVEVIEGTATPFILNYKLDKSDKSGFFMTSSADISIFETPTFNIDNLKTSSETEIKVEYYINNVLDWSGFVIPDFFSKTIGTPATVEMVASDRIGTLKGVTLSGLAQYESMRDLAVDCLERTGLTLPLYTMADFGNNGQTNAFFKALGLSSRLSDTKGRNISCYNILKSILVASDSKLVQQSGAWYIVNKFQHEQGAGNLFSTLTASTAYSEQTVDFSDVHVGARRTIIPVGATTGVFHEFGGGRSYPDNFDFADGLSGWTTAGTFVATIDNREITGYDFGPIGATTRFGDPTDKNYLLNKNVFNVANYIQSADIDVPYDTGRIEVVLDINAIGPRMSQAIAAANLRVSVGATSGSQTLWLNTSGLFQSGSVIIHNLYFSRGVGNFETANFSVKGVLEQPSGYNVFVRIYGSNEAALDLRETAINFATISFNNTIESPKGLIYRRNQGTGFTKEHEIDTTIFGDYMRKGLDGYFYEYRIDDTSSLYSTAGTLTEPLWTAHGDTEQLPLLRHVTRQKSRMFSVAHNIISARVDVSTFKPLSIFVDCNSVRHVVVSASYDFLRSEVEVELEQIAYATLDVMEFIYSYFGDGEKGISSVGGISGGGTGGGGGMTSSQLEMLTNLADWWKLDEENDAIYSEKSVYSLKGVSALGLGSEGGGGGGDFDRLDAWADYDSTKSGWVLSALLGYDLHTRVNDLEASAGDNNIDIEITGSGNAVTDVSKSGNTLTFDKGNTFALSTHNHVIANITGLQDALDGKEPSFTKNTAFNKNFGTTAGTVAQGNDSRIINGQTAFSWGNHASAGYALNSALTAHTGNSTIHITSAERTNWNLAYTNNHTHGNKSVIDALTQGHINVLNKLSLDEQGNVKVDATLWATGGISALGLGEGGSGGDFDRLDAWADYDSTKSGWVLSALLGVDLNNRLSSVEGGSATSVSVSGTGDVIVGGSKSGNVITLTRGNQSWDNLSGKPATFTPTSHTHSASDITSGIFNIARIPTGTSGSTVALGNHLHTGVYEPVFTKNTAFNKNFGTTAGTVAQGNDSRIINGQTAYGWGNHSGLYLPLSGGTIDNSASINKTSTGFAQTPMLHFSNMRAQIAGVPIIRMTNSEQDKGFGILNNGELGFGNWSQVSSMSSSWNTVYHAGNLTSLSQLTDNIGVASHIANKANPHAVTTAQIGAVDLTTNQSIRGIKSFNNYIQINGSTSIDGNTLNIFLSGSRARIMYGESTTADSKVAFGSGWGTVDDFAVFTKTSGSFSAGTQRFTVKMDGNVGIGTTNPLYKLDVAGTGRFTGNVTAPTFIGALSGNASTATKLQTPRTIAGVSFDGSDNIAIPFANLASKPTTLSGYGITDGALKSLTLTAGNGLTGGGTLEANRAFALGTPSTLTAASTNAVTSTSHTHAITTTTVGAANTIVATDASGGVRGNIIRIGGNWTLELSGTELVFKYNGVIKQRMLSDGTILAVGGVTALTTN